MLVDLQWVRMAKKRLALIDAWDDVTWISHGEEAQPVGRVAPHVKNSDIAVTFEFEVKTSE